MSTEENNPKKKKKWSLSNLIFTDEETTEESTETSEDISVSNDGDGIVQDTGTPLPINIPTSGDGIFDQKFHDMLQGVIAENNIEGNDYFEFRQAVENMDSIAGLNESAKLLTAYATLKSSNDPEFNKEKLMSSIDHYIGVLRGEESEFNEAMQSELENKVNSKRTKAGQLVDDNKALAQQIQNLNEQIVQNNNESMKLNQEAQNEEARISQTNKNFSTTLDKVVSKLETDKQKIEDLIQEGTTKTA